MMRWPYVSREFLASAEARAKAEHENAMALRHALVREEARADQERAERIASSEAAERRLAIWKNGTEVLEKALLESRIAEAAATQNAQKLSEILNRESASYERDMVRSEARYADLLARFTALRLEGAQDPPPPVPGIEREAPDENEAAINKVIREQSDGDHARARELRKYARELKNQGKTADEIIGALVETWSTESVAPLH